MTKGRRPQGQAVGPAPVLSAGKVTLTQRDSRGRTSASGRTVLGKAWAAASVTMPSGLQKLLALTGGPVSLLTVSAQTVSGMPDNDRWCRQPKCGRLPEERVQHSSAARLG